jgi:ADP-heptose:LPS heptosyltransferase
MTVSLKNRNIIIFKLNMLGDSVCFVPALSELKDRMPDLHITLVCFSYVKSIFESSQLVDEIITLDNIKDFQGFKKWKTILLLYSKLKKCKYGSSISSYESFSIIALLNYILRIPIRIGYSKYCKLYFLFTHLVPLNWHENIIIRDYRSIEVFFALNNVDGRIIPRRVPIKYSNQQKSLIDKILFDNGIENSDKVIVLHPSSSRKSRRWPLDKFKLLLQNMRITFPKIKIFIIGTNNELSICKAISSDTNVINLCGQINLLELSCLLSGASIFIGHSSGPFHIAHANGVPTITLWGASDSKIWGPFWNEVKNVVIDKKMFCSPCETFSVRQEVCPLGTLDCMKGIEVMEVMEVIKGILI